MLSKPDEKKYVEQNGAACPFCGTDEFDGSDYYADCGTVWQEMTCLECKAEWTDIYTLTSIEYLGSVEVSDGKDR
mgnify:FL=1